MLYRYDLSSQEFTKFADESDIYMPVFYNNGTKGVLPIGDNILEGNLLVEGCTRSGKTTVLIGLVKRLRRQHPDGLFIFFDPKRDFLPLYERGDFLCSFYEDNKDCKNFKWNLLKEAMEQQHPDDQLRELIGVLFDESISNSRDPFFMNAAKQVFIGYCMTFIRRYTRNPQEPIASNKEILELLNRMSVEQLRNRLSMESDNKSVIETLIPTVNGIPTKQAQGVLACLTEVLTLFCGTFAGEGMDTVSGFLKESGKGLFLEYDYSRSKSANTFYHLILKMIIENKLSMNSDPNKKVFLILDEAAILGGDFDLSNALNVGGGLGLRTILACQSTAQLSNLVPDRKEYLADGLMAGFASVIAFRINDAKSLETIQKQFGEANFAYYNFGLSRYEHSNISIQKESTVLSKDLTSLNLGEAYVKLKGAAPVKVKFIKED